MIRLNYGTDKSKVLKLEFRSISGLVELAPTDTWEGQATVYENVISNEEWTSDFKGLSLEDSEFQDRFSNLLVIKDHISQAKAFLFRDHKENRIIALGGFSQSTDWLDSLPNSLTLDAVVVAVAGSPFTTRDELPSSTSNLIITNGFINNGVTIEKVIGDYKVEHKSSGANVFISLGSSDLICGEGVSISFARFFKSKIGRMEPMSYEKKTSKALSLFINL